MVATLVSFNTPIFRAGQIKDAVKEVAALEVDDLLVRRVMRKDLKMGYRLARQVPVQSNSERCLVLRQQYSLTMLPELSVGRRIINVDESWLNSTRFLRRLWVPTNAPATFSDKQVSPRISLILALDTEGRIWFALTQANTDTDIMTTFLRHLVRQLDREDPGWEVDSLILLDNAKWHSNDVMKARLACM